MQWHIVLIGIITGVAIHKMMEPVNILFKLNRLKQAMTSGKIIDPQVKGINTRTKAYALGLAAIAIPSAIAYFVASLFDPSVDSAIRYSVAVALISQIILMIRVDQYHVEIEKLTQAQKKR